MAAYSEYKSLDLKVTLQMQKQEDENTDMRKHTHTHTCSSSNINSVRIPCSSFLAVFDWCQQGRT